MGIGRTAERRRRCTSGSAPIHGALTGWFVAWIAFLASGCGENGGSQSAFVLESCHPKSEAEPLLLNDDIRLTFSAPIDATTVTRDSVRLVDEETGLEARGSWDVDGRLLRFRPAGVRLATLDKGGYRPGGTYRLSVAGFPFLGSVRTAEGAALDRSVSLTFTIVAVGAPPGSSQAPHEQERRILRDASPGRTAPIRILPGDPGSTDTLPLQWDEPLRLVCDEPLDPRTIDPDDYEIRLLRDPNLGPTLVERIVLEANEAEDVGMSTSRPGARLVVTPKSPLPVQSGAGAQAYEFRLRAPSLEGVTDFSGGQALQSFRPVRFFVARQEVHSAERADSYELDFADDVDFVPVLDPSSDGTARWSGNGRVEVRYPAAAGDGSAGAVVLADTEARPDIAATRLTLPSDTTTRLTGSGLVVLRAQGRIDLSGRLVRAAPAGGVTPMWDPIERPFDESMKDAESLSAWLRRARESDDAWTVIIAGGDLVVTGDIDVQTPLLLVAGGRIRGAGTPRATPGQLWLLGDGGGFKLPHHTDPSAHPNVRPPLQIDEPLANPLVEPLTFVAISSPVPKGSRPRSWLEPLVLGGRGSSGEHRVQYLRKDALSMGEEGLGQAVRYDQPNLVVDPDSPGGNAVRLRIELVVRPGTGAWDPPYVDRVRLAWSLDR